MNEKLNQLSLLEYSYDIRLHRAVIIVEDKRFLFHFGHDLPSIFRAILNNIKTTRIQGASTIEQQLVRIILKENSMTIRRKILEILLSTEIPNKLTKSQTINIYLDNYIFSNSVIGLDSFCRKEGYNLEMLSNKDICEIVARIKYPTINHRNYVRYLRRVRTIEILSNCT